jgi:predicted Rossmann fold nucleotide-binding protein DprA/Smf involved in DNA uptake
VTLRVDDLIQATQLDAREIASMLLMLELDGWIEHDQGGYRKIKIREKSEK